MAACCLYHLNWYKSQPLLDQDEMRPENRLWPHERWVYGSQECFRTDRYDTGLYSATVNISHRHTKYWFVPCKMPTTTNQANQAYILAFLSFLWLILMEKITVNSHEPTKLCSKCSSVHAKHYGYGSNKPCIAIHVMLTVKLVAVCSYFYVLENIILAISLLKSHLFQTFTSTVKSAKALNWFSVSASKRL